VHLNKGTANLNQASDIMIDQIRSIDNRRLTKKLGILPEEVIDLVKENIKIVLDFE
jgi:mRNA interferase MazF